MLLLGLLLACARLEPSADPRWNLPDPACPAATTPEPRFARGSVRFTTPAGTRTFDAELARTEIEQQRGLMYRRSLALDAAMVFSTNAPADARFWMKDTCIALDLVWVGSDDRVIEVQTADAMETRVRGAMRQSIHVIELGAGVAAANGIGPGTLVEVR